MKQLGDRNYAIISRGVSTLGTYDPEKIFFLFEEDLLMNEGEDIYDFLLWCHTKDRTFGFRNYEAVFKDFKEHARTT